MWNFNEYNGLPKYKNLQKYTNQEKIKARIGTSFRSSFSSFNTGVDSTKNPLKFKKVVLDVNKPSVLN